MSRMARVTMLDPWHDVGPMGFTLDELERLKVEVTIL